jgi:hypothetical protein
MVKIVKEEPSESTSLVANQKVVLELPVVSNVVPHQVETVHPPLFLSVTLVLNPLKIAFIDISLMLVPLRLLELQWVMMAEPKDSPMLNSNQLSMPQRHLSLMVSNVTVESLDLTFPPHHPVVVVIEVAEAVLVVAVAVVLAIEAAEAASVIEAAEAASEIEAEVASVAEEASVEEPQEAVVSKINLSDSDPFLIDT